MVQLVQAVFEQGVLRPLEPVELADHAQVQLIIQPSPSQANESPDDLSRQQKAIEELLAALKLLPQPENPDGFDCADHDAVLYGRPA